jgi:rod shape-determining protein MreD
MRPSSLRIATVVVPSLIVAMALRIVFLPGNLFNFNPDWVLLCLIYWSMAIPERVGVVTAWVTGLFTDVLTGRMLGQHALAYAVIVFLCVKVQHRLRFYPISQQILSILGLLILSQILIFWTQNMRAISPFSWFYWTPSLTGCAVWPLVLVTLRSVRRRYGIY